MNSFNNFDKIKWEDLLALAPADDLVRFWRSKVKVSAGRRGGEGIHVDAGASKSHLLTVSFRSVGPFFFSDRCRRGTVRGQTRPLVEAVHVTCGDVTNVPLIGWRLKSSDITGGVARPVTRVVAGTLS